MFVLLPVNDVIERDWLSTGVNIYLLLKLGGEIHCLQMVQQLYGIKERKYKNTEEGLANDKTENKNSLNKSNIDMLINLYIVLNLPASKKMISFSHTFL